MTTECMIYKEAYNKEKECQNHYNGHKDCSNCFIWKRIMRGEGLQIEKNSELEEAYQFMHKVSKKLEEGSEEGSWAASAMDRVATFLHGEKGIDEQLYQIRHMIDKLTTNNADDLRMKQLLTLRKMSGNIEKILSGEI